LVENKEKRVEPREKKEIEPAERRENKDEFLCKGE
jgi:hypothetical protein